MSPYRITPAADADLEAAWLYVAEHSGETAADQFEDDLHRAMQRLVDMPGIGHVRGDLADESLRFFGVHKLLIVYRPETRPIQIVRVLHGPRDILAILRDDLGKGGGSALH
jgi:plasmid stabilization system protein ParE